MTLPKINGFSTTALFTIVRLISLSKKLLMDNLNSIVKTYRESSCDVRYFPLLLLLTLIYLIPLVGLVGCGIVHSPTSETPYSPNPTQLRLPPQPVNFSVASVNAFLFFDTTCDSNACNGSWEKAYTDSQFQQRVQKLAADINSLNADIVVLQEIESLDALQALKQHLPNYPHGAIAETGVPASIDTAILAKIPIEKLQTFNITKTSKVSSRLLIAADFKISDFSVTVLGVHLQSKRSDPKGYIRNQQLAHIDTVTRHLKARNPDTPIILAGDFNATSDEISDTPIPSFYREVVGLEGKWWTYIHNGQKEVIDHIYYTYDSVLRPTSTLDINHQPQHSDHSLIRADFTTQPPLN